MLCPWPVLTVLVTASLATSAPLARRGGGSTDQSQQVSGTSDGSYHPIGIDSSQTVENNFGPPPKIPSAVNNAPDPVGLAWVLGHMGQVGNQDQGGDGISGADPSSSSSATASANQRREVPPIGAMIGPLMDGLGMAGGMMGGMGGGGGGGSSGGGGGSADGSSQSSEDADESYHPISVNSGQHVQNNFRRAAPLRLRDAAPAPPPPPPASSSAPPPPPSSSAAPPPPSSAPPPPSSTPASTSSSSSASTPPSSSLRPSSTHMFLGPGPVILSPSQLADHGPMATPHRIGTTIPKSGASSDGQSQSDGDGGDGDDGNDSGGSRLPKAHLSGHSQQNWNNSGNDGSSHVNNVTSGAVTTGDHDRICYLPAYEGEQASYTTNSVYNTNVSNNSQQGSKNQQQNQQSQGSNRGQQHQKNGGQQNANGGQNGGGNGKGQNNRRAVFARGGGHNGGGGGGGGGECGNCVCNCDCSPNRRSVNVTPSSLHSFYERRGATKKVVTPANCAVVKSQGGLVYSGDQCHLKGQPAKVSG